MPRCLFAVVLLLSCAAVSFVSARTAMRPEVGRFPEYVEQREVQPNPYATTQSVPVVTRFYSIRPLLTDFFIVRTEPKFVPASRGCFGGHRPAHYETEEELEEQIISLIRDTVDTNSWLENGGSVGSIRTVSGIVAVTQTPENQAMIAQILNRLYTCSISPTTQPIELK